MMNEPSTRSVLLLLWMFGTSKVASCVLRFTCGVGTVSATAVERTVGSFTRRRDLISARSRQDLGALHSEARRRQEGVELPVATAEVGLAAVRKVYVRVLLHDLVRRGCSRRRGRGGGRRRRGRGRRRRRRRCSRRRRGGRSRSRNRNRRKRRSYGRRRRDRGGRKRPLAVPAAIVALALLAGAIQILRGAAPAELVTEWWRRRRHGGRGECGRRRR